MKSNAMAEMNSSTMQKIAWSGALILSLIMLFKDFYTAFSLGNLSVAQGTLVGRDFVNVFTGGRLVLESKLDLIYDVSAYYRYQDTLFNGLVQWHNYSYTPVSFLYIWFFGLFPYAASYLLWVSLTGTAFFLAARAYVREGGLPSWAALFLPAVAVNIWAGHYGLLFGALWLGAWRLLETHPRTAGVLVGLMIVKPHLAILVPFALIRRRAWTTFVFAGFTVLAAIVLSGLIFGVRPWMEFVGKTMGYQAAMVDDVDKFFLLMMPTVTASLNLLGAPASMVWAIQTTVALFMCAALWRWMPEDSKLAGLATGCATFLVLPYAFIYDMTVVNVAALLVLHRTTDLRNHPAICGLATLAFLLPLVTLGFNAAHVPITSLLILFLLIMLLFRPPLAHEPPSSDLYGSD